jgi:hypothetical protein
MDILCMIFRELCWIVPKPTRRKDLVQPFITGKCLEQHSLKQLEIGKVWVFVYFLFKKLYNLFH